MTHNTLHKEYCIQTFEGLHFIKPFVIRIHHLEFRQNYNLERPFILNILMDSQAKEGFDEKILWSKHFSENGKAYYHNV